MDDIIESYLSTSINTTGNDPFPRTGYEDDIDDVENINPDGGSGDEIDTNTTGVQDPYIVNKRPLQVAEQPLPPEEEQPPPEGMPPEEMDPSMMGGAGGMDPSMMGGAGGMGMPDEGPQSPQAVGRIYELKKIYARLVAVNEYLANTSDPSLVELKTYIANAKDLFRTLISNIDLFMDRLDEIIVVFYKFLDEVYKILSRYYKDKDTYRTDNAVMVKIPN